MLVCIWTYRLSIVEKGKKNNMIMELKKILEDSDDDVEENEDIREFAVSVGDDDRIKPRAIKSERRRANRY
ncbi:hypothetical protein TSUD_144470 [Trifolium subterraneum]|uniref:Uncharacterized protein n=1 Tax=Trifolium subterraneum TaxID=3900 RepID=A0A2Z6N5E7_TRISU|nr:hypothetical protein TSUD_144470 [Trifolium subterraneum]